MFWLQLFFRIFCSGYNCFFEFSVLATSLECSGLAETVFKCPVLALFLNFWSG